MTQDETLRIGAAMRAARNLFAAPEESEHVFELIRALEGKTMRHMCHRMRHSAEGRRLLRQKPNILLQLCDREALAALPEGSLGHAYLAFVDSEGIDAEGLIEASDMHPTNYGDADLKWASDWLRDTHDLWHTVLGYQGDLIGEAALLAFSHEHVRNRGLAVIASLAWWKLGRVTDKSVEARKTIVHGRRLAKETVWFVDVPWHEWLARPLAEVRRDLGVTAPVSYQAVRTEEVDTRLVA